MSPMPTIYEIRRTATRDELSLDAVWTQPQGGPLESGYRHLIAMQIDGTAVIIGISNETGIATAWRWMPGSDWLRPVELHLAIGASWDVVDPLVIGNVPHLLTYVAEPVSPDQRQFAFYPIDSKLRSHPPFAFRRTHSPGVTSGFTVAHPIIVGASVYYLCYGFDSGRVLIYSLDVVAESVGGLPPLASKVIWEHQWARRWTRFAFFQLGASTCFLKTNIGRLNVNIDKVLDNPGDGTVEVATALDLDNALELDIVTAFYLGHREPHFLTYMKNGATTLNRFHADLSGWATVGRHECVQGATHVLPLYSGDASYVLVY